MSFKIRAPKFIAKLAKTKNRRVAAALKGVSRDLSRWSKDVVGDTEKKLKEAKRELENCRKQAITPEKVAEEVRLWCLVDHLEEVIDIKCRQRAHIWWLKEGDRNTKVFFRYASARRKANRIRRLRREDRVVVEEGRDLTNYVMSYFQDLFTSNGYNQYDELLQVVPVKVTSAMNESLTAAFSDMEIKAALD